MARHAQLSSLPRRHDRGEVAPEREHGAGRARLHKLVSGRPGQAARSRTGFELRQDPLVPLLAEARDVAGERGERHLRESFFGQHVMIIADRNPEREQAAAITGLIEVERRERDQPLARVDRDRAERAGAERLPPGQQPGR
jgi:hypothetical protein